MADYSLIGFIVILAGIAVIVFASLASAHQGERKETEVKGGGVVMIGPVPIIFGNDARWIIVAIVLAGLLLFLGVVANWR